MLLPIVYTDVESGKCLTDLFRSETSNSMTLDGNTRTDDMDLIGPAKKSD